MTDNFNYAWMLLLKMELQVHFKKSIIMKTQQFIKGTQKASNK